jgi:hypothetical protein
LADRFWNDLRHLDFEAVRLAEARYRKGSELIRQGSHIADVYRFDGLKIEEGGH